MDPGSALVCVLGPVLPAGGIFAVFIFQKGAQSNQPVPWKRAGDVSAVTRAWEDERRTMTLLCCLSPVQKQAGINLSPTWDRHKCQDTERVRAVYSGNVRASQPCWVHKGLLLPPQHKLSPAERVLTPLPLHQACPISKPCCSASLNFPKMINLPLSKGH